MSFVRRFICPKVRLSEGSFVWRFICTKVHLSEGSSVRRFTCPIYKIHTNNIWQYPSTPAPITNIPSPISYRSWDVEYWKIDKITIYIYIDYHITIPLGLYKTKNNCLIKCQICMCFIIAWVAKIYTRVPSDLLFEIAAGNSEEHTTRCFSNKVFLFKFSQIAH